MARFDRQIETAIRLIKKNGQKVIWRQTAKPSDTLEPWKQQDAASIDKDAIICFLPVDKETREFLTYIRGTDVPMGSELGLMGAVDFEPSIEDVVLRDGKTYRIKHIDLLSPNGQKILYTIEFAI